MAKIEFEIIKLEWEKSEYSDAPDTSGVYQIYGTSPLYGTDTLLYIGKATSLKSRLKEHFDSKESFIGRQPNKSCRFAKVEVSLLDVVEQTLIAMHKPSFNSANLINLTPEGKTRAIYIQNHGERGMLNIENTNYYFINNSNDDIPFDIIETLDYD